MEPIIILLAIGVPILGIVLVIWLIARAVSARDRIEELTRRLGRLERDVLDLKKAPVAVAAAPVPETAAEGVLAQVVEEARRRRETTMTPTEATSAQEPIPPATTPMPMPVPRPAVSIPEMQSKPFAAPPLIAQAHSPATLETRPAFVSPPPPPAPSPAPPLPAKPAINWEQFMGVKGFAWLGGLALFLGVAFFVKYSFDNNLVPPAVRAAIGFLTGLGLLAGGLVMSRKNFPALSQTLCATGVLILYAVTFACHAFYHFEFFGAIPTFLLMALITAAAFVVAAYLNGLVVAILGMLGGFLTPILLSTGQDNPLGLFGYIAILDIGLIVVALNRRWHFLTALAALGTVILQAGWAAKFFEHGKYFEGSKIFIPLAVLAGFNLLWLGGNWFAKKRQQPSRWLSVSNLGLAAVALAFTAFFLSFAPLAGRPALLFGFVFLIDVVVAALAWLDPKVSVAQPLAGLTVFGLLAAWTTDSLNNQMLNTGLAFYFLFALFHAGLPGLMRRLRGEASGAVSKASHFFPPLALLLVLVPIFKLTELSFIVWPFVLLVDLIAIGLAALTMTLLPVLAVLLLTLAATGALILKIPVTLTGLTASFLLIGAFAVFFVGAAVWLLSKVKASAPTDGAKTSWSFAPPEAIPELLAASSAILPFLLLIMAIVRLPLANPTPVFGLALLLVVLVLGLTRMFSMDWLPVVGLAGAFAVEFTWHFNRFDIANPNVAPFTAVAWYLIFLGVFAAFPFLFLKQFSEKSPPWVAAALAGPAQFLLVFRLVKIAWPNSVMGLLPAAFAIPALASLFGVLKRVPGESKARLDQLAWFGGVALFFITLIFPIQFDRQWITIGWGLEGAALLWLFHRVPHAGLRAAGIGLLTAAFARLALNPAVLEYHQRAATPIFNWYLYTYGIVTVALFAGVRLLAPPRNIVAGTDARPLLGTMGTVLAFLLMNIEIADYFSEPGSTLTFQFSGNFGRDMTYSIAWALFALVLLVCGIYKKLPAARYAAMGLLCVTLLKLFLHDLARLGPLYRIGAFIGVAIIAMVASFAYQKFFSAAAKVKEA